MRIVCYENFSFEPLMYFFSNHFEAGSRKHHFRSDACKPGNVIRYISSGIDERMEGVCNIETIVVIDRDFRYPVISRKSPRSLDINNCVHGGNLEFDFHLKADIDTNFHFAGLNFIIRFFLNGLAVFVTAWLLDGVDVAGYGTALVVALVISIANVIVKPVLIILTIPITILTMGLFLLVINAIIILLVDSLVDGFVVHNFWWALLCSLILAVFNSMFNDISKKREE
jgi:putative membrane protein